MSSFFFHLTHLTLCAVGRFFCCHLLYLTTYLYPPIVSFALSRCPLWTLLHLSQNLLDLLIWDISYFCVKRKILWLLIGSLFFVTGDTLNGISKRLKKIYKRLRSKNDFDLFGGWGLFRIISSVELHSQ